MGSPTTTTVKRLFAVSGNRCAFPNCSWPLVDPDSRKVTARICHIKANQPGGARYDASQTEDERQSFNNLLLLCPAHHDVIDSDPEAYTVTRLISMKTKHESSQAAQPEPSDAIAKQIIANAQGNAVTQGSIIISQHQMGGQIAHSIQNIGQQPRRFSEAEESLLKAELSKHPVESIEIGCLAGDAEGFQLATALKRLLESAGWHVSEVSQGFYNKPISGICFETPAARPGLVTLLNWLGATGLKPEGILDKNARIVRLIVGANL